MTDPSSSRTAHPLSGALAPDVTAHERDLVLLRRIRTGDVDAFAELFDIYFQSLHRFALLYAASAERAEDAVQDVFARVWEGRARWEVRTSVAQYLFGAVRNRALQLTQSDDAAQRREAQVVSVQSPTVSGAGTSELEAAELRRHLEQAVAELPPRCREIFVLSRVRRMSQKEIADTLGIAIPTIKVQLGRALRALELARRTYELG